MEESGHVIPYWEVPVPTPMTAPDLAALLKIAEAATPGPWKAQFSDTERAGVAEIDGKGWQSFAEVYVARSNGESNPEGRANAAHIAAFNPTVAQALVRVAMAAKDDARFFPVSQDMREALSALTAALKGNPHA